MSKTSILITSFVVVLLLSVVSSLPLSWVLNQPQVKQQIPKNMILKNITGSWWQGEVMLSIKTPATNTELGKITFELDWLPLVWANISADIKWKIGKGQINAKLNFNGETVEITALTGDVKVGEIVQLSEQTALLADAKGELHLVDMEISLPIKQAWPSHIAGKLAITDFAAMGANFDLLEAKPVLKGNDIKTQITGGQQSKGWSLNADTVLSKNHSYQLDLKVTATNPNNMPDWVALMLPMKNPKLAKLKRNGRW